MASQQCLIPHAQMNQGHELGEGRKRRRGRRRQGLNSCGRKRPRLEVATPAAKEEEVVEAKEDYFNMLPDDVLLTVLSKFSASSDRPRDLISAQMTCRRFLVLGNHPIVMAKASSRCLAVKAKAWSEASHRFLKRCVDAGNLEACYILGMIRFYALENRGGGASLMAKAAIASNPTAMYSLAIIQFNGSGGSKSDKDLRAGVALCARAAFLGHVDALRELGHCLQDGYGVRRNVDEGRRFLVQANARELALAVTSWPAWLEERRHATAPLGGGAALGCCPLISDYGWNLPAPEPHPANQFLVEWFRDKGAAEGLRLCSHRGCGRPETRRHEFRRCSVCGIVNYCSRACQALDWKLSHKAECVPTGQALPDGLAAAGDEAPAPAPAPAAAVAVAVTE